jgi:hypothetical protein
MIVPVALVAVPAYLLAMSLCAVLVERDGHGWLNVLVILFFWNAMKFARLAVPRSIQLRARLAERAFGHRLCWNRRSLISVQFDLVQERVEPVVA